jgi:hypothetical protein
MFTKNKEKIKITATPSNKETAQVASAVIFDFSTSQKEKREEDAKRRVHDSALSLGW